MNQGNIQTGVRVDVTPGDHEVQVLKWVNPFKREDVCIERLGVARVRPSHICGCTGLYGASALLGLPHREPLGYHVLRQCFRIRSRCNSSRVSHTDIASQ